MDATGLIRTALPIAAVGLVNLAMTITDAVMMAGLDPRALASGAIVGDIYSIFVQFAAGALSAYTPRIAAAFADRDNRLAGMIAGEGVRASIVLGFAGAICIASIPAALGAAGMHLPLPQATQTYAHFMAGTFGFMVIVILARNAFPALDRGSLPVYVLSAAVPLNALFNALLMYGWLGFPEMGLAGAGASSMAVSFFMSVLFVAYACFAPQLKELQIARHSARLSRHPMFVRPGEMFMVGAAALCETGVFLVSTMMIGFYEMDSVPSHIAVFRMVAVTYVMSTGIGQAITIHAARVKDRAGRAKALERAALLVAALSAPMVAALVAIVPLSIFSMTGTDSATICRLAPFAGISMFAMVPTLAIRGFLRAIPDSFAPAAIGAGGYWCAGFPAMLYLAGPAGYGASGVWGGLAIGTTATAMALIVYIIGKKHLKWQFGSQAAIPNAGNVAGIARGRFPWPHFARFMAAASKRLTRTTTVAT